MDDGQTKRSPRLGGCKKQPRSRISTRSRIGDERVDAFPRGSRLFRGHKPAKLDDESSMSRFSRLSILCLPFTHEREEKERAVGEEKVEEGRTIMMRGKGSEDAG